LPHPAAWMLMDNAWQLSMDEYGNTYYYNSTTEESQWDPPEELQQGLNLPTTELTFAVEVPDHAIPGQAFTTIINGCEIQIMCPVDVIIGSILELTCPTDDQLAYYDPDAFCAPNAETAAVAAVSIDPREVWISFADVGGFELDKLELDAVEAKVVVDTISDGSYGGADIFQLGWAYKFSVFQNALCACFAAKGDFFDSSPYDNCDGTPRYEQSGFIEWYNELTRQRNGLLVEMNSDGWEEKLSSEGLMEQCASDYSKLVVMAAGGDDQSFLNGLIQREMQAVDTLKNLQSRLVFCTESY
jgi:hypothetical protein